METKDLILKAREAQEMLVRAIMDYVRDNGEDFTDKPLDDYYTDEFGIDDEEHGDKVVKLLNLYDADGCHFAVQERVNDDDVKAYWDDCSYGEATWCCFHHHAYWAFYIVRNEAGEERLKYYQFHNQGIVFDDEESEPDHGDAEYLGLEQLHYIIEAIIKVEN